MSIRLKHIIRHNNKQQRFKNIQKLNSIPVKRIIWSQAKRYQKGYKSKNN